MFQKGTNYGRDIVQKKKVERLIDKELFVFLRDFNRTLIFVVFVVPLAFVHIEYDLVRHLSKASTEFDEESKQKRTSFSHF